MGNLLLALQAGDAILAMFQKYQETVGAAIREGRDLTDAELDGLVADDDAARAALAAQISAARQ